MSRPQVPTDLRLTITNVAGGRLTSGWSNEYDPVDRTAEFTRVIAATRPDLIVVSELDCSPGSEQMWRIADALTAPAVAVHTQGFSDSHIPGVDRLGVGIAARYPLHGVTHIRLPQPPFEMLHWSTGERHNWHPKGLLVAECETPTGNVHVVAGQVHPIHIARDSAGVGYSYEYGPGSEFGRKTARFVRFVLGRLGVRRAVIAGDLNMPDPRRFFTHVGKTPLRDAFGPGPAPPTTQDGRSLDRAFATEDVDVVASGVSWVPRADHAVAGFTFRFRDEASEHAAARARRRGARSAGHRASAPPSPTSPDHGLGD